MYDTSKLIEGAKELNIELTEKQIENFLKFYEMLIEKNKVMNLTAITEFDEVVTKHFLDSIAIVKAISIEKGMKIMDVGTGAGFPGVPIKIVFPEVDIVLLDSLNKRINFLNEVANELGFTSFKAIHGRSEEVARNKEYREQFDLVVSRAVANMSILSEYCIPFVKKGGCFVAYKSANANDEMKESLSAIKKLGGEVIDEINFRLPETDVERVLVKVNKNNNTPQLYPRKPGTPAKMPLK